MTETPQDFGTIPATPAYAGAPEPQYTTTAHTAPEPAEREESPLDALRKEATRELDQPVTFKVAGREGFAVRFSNQIEPEDVKRYRKNALGKRKNPEDADQIIASAQPLIENNRAILLNGKVITASDGEDLTFQHKEFADMFGGMGAIHAVRLFLGPGQTLSMGGALFEEAGYGADVETVDPR